MYINEEEEFFAQGAEFVADFKVGKGTKWTLQEEAMVMHRRVAIVHRSKIQGIIKEIEEEINKATNLQK